MSELKLYLFGPCQVILNGEPVTAFRMHKVQALLVYLAAELHTAHRREQLMTMFWPRMPESSARSNLRQILFHLRQAIPDVEQGGGPTPRIIANRHTIQLNPEADIFVDTNQFEGLLAKIQDHNHLDLLTCPICHADLQTAASFYKGNFLADFYLEDSNEFEEWA